MISTFSAVKTRVLALLDDPNQRTFTDPIVLEGMNEATDALYGAFVFYEIPRAKVVAYYTLPANTTNVSPATAGITDMGEVIEVSERGSSAEKYRHVDEVDDLDDRPMATFLGQWEWRGDNFWFVGSTMARELRISYFTTVEAQSDFSQSTGVDGARTFLSKYCAGMIGPRKGYDMAKDYMLQAVGSRYNDGVIGGELFRLCQPMVRSRQRVPVAPKPYSVIRRRIIRKPPYIAAQQPAGVGMAPIQFSTEDGTITGTIDGVNDTFYLAYPVSSANVYRSGVLMTQPTDVAWVTNQIIFAASQIPQLGDVITVLAWL